MNDQTNLKQTINTTMENLPQKQITGAQMRMIIEMCGKNCPQFARFLKKSESYVYQSLGHIVTYIPFIYYDALVVFVGEVNFHRTLRELGIKP